LGSLKELTDDNIENGELNTSLIPKLRSGIKQYSELVKSG